MSGACFSPEPAAGSGAGFGASRETGSTVEVLRAHEDLVRLVPEWEELAAHALEPNPFYEPWMALPALEAFAGESPPLFVAVRQGGRLDALFPLERIARYKGLPFAALKTWRHPHCLLCAPLVRSDGAAEALKAFFAWTESRDGAQLLELRYLPAGGALHCALVDAMNRAGLTAPLAEAYTRPVLRKAASAEAYFAAAHSREGRKKLGRKERRLAELGKSAHVALGAQDDAARWIEDFLALEASGWKGTAGSALACSEAGRRFARSVLAEAHRRGRLLMTGIDLDGRPIGRNCTILAGEGGFAFKTAYDEQFSACSPGVLAELARIRLFHDAPGLQWIDSFTVDNARLDAMWKDRMVIERLLVGLGPRGELALATLSLGRWMARRLRRKSVA